MRIIDCQAAARQAVPDAASLAIGARHLGPRLVATLSNLLKEMT